MSHNYIVTYLFALIACLYIVGCRNISQISYQRDVRPILEDKCTDCHLPPDGKGYKKVGLNMESYETLLYGSVYGPVILPGNSKKSPLNMLVEGRAGNLSAELKKNHKPITDNEIKILQLWVEQGARNN
jgi:hypothetical protein